MKKAKEYAKEFDGATEAEMEDKITKIFKELISEVSEIKEARNAQSPGAMLSIFQAQNEKWNAIVRIVPEIGLGKDGFIRVARNLIPELKALEIALKAEGKLR